MPERIIIFAGLLPVALLSLPAYGGTASYSYPYAFLNRVEGDVSLQRASEPEPEASAVNLPVLPGDRIWTGAGSRAEVRFANGNLLRLDAGTKIDFTELDAGVLLRGWSGSVILKINDPSDTVRLDTPGGSVAPSSVGSYRVDIDGDQTILSVSRGAAELVSGRGSAFVESGQASVGTAGEPPGAVETYNTASFDAFDAWSESLDRWASSRRDVVVRSLPHEVDPYAATLGQYGSWTEDATYGSVWYPQVSVGWAPYQSGRWCYTNYGYTWVSSEPWGWAPYHYGRWGFGQRGWYWIPGSSWSPAWVSFAVGPFWVGWSPLGYHDRPVFGFDSHDGPRRHHGDGWNFTTHDDFRRGRAPHRLDPRSVEQTVATARFAQPGAALDRELNPRSGASPRGYDSSRRWEARERASASPRTASPRGFVPSTSARTSSPESSAAASAAAFGRSRSPSEGESSGRGNDSTSRPGATSSWSSPQGRERPSGYERNRSGRAFWRPELPSTSSGTSTTGVTTTGGAVAGARSATSGSRAFSTPGGRQDGASASRGERPGRTVSSSGYTRPPVGETHISASRSDRGYSRPTSGGRDASSRGSVGARGSDGGARSGGGGGGGRSSSPSRRKN
jgi:Family of unknown function (DUF6600)/FecR protein